jgi:23S rRNA (cytidine1920-2'-O)/16S rRNA (cytidine1409-2'-O)-methyltransferase
MGTKRVRLLDLLRSKFPETGKKELHAITVCGEVYVDDERIRDPRHMTDPGAEITISRSAYVSRGGEKLEYALESWELPMKEKIFLDAGSSTGGFTDCLLKHGAKAVHSVDVGYNQIAYTLRRDPRVILHERTNLMDLTDLSPVPHAAVADLSFRSIVGAAAKLLGLTREGWAIVLIKPQFEFAARSREGTADFGGVVDEPERLADILDETLAALESRSIPVAGLLESPIRGRKGNREFLAHIGRDPAGGIPGKTSTTPADVIEGLRREAGR